MRPIIHSTKHYIQTSLSTVTGLTQNIITLVNAVAVPDKNIVSEVEEGAIVKACYVEAWLRTLDSVGGSFIVVLWKQPGGAANFSLTEMAALGDADAKKNIFFVSQGLANSQTADATPVLRGWYKIPKSKQRFGLGDKLLLQIFAQSTIDVAHCGFATYKEYT